MSKARHHHYISQFYLRGFATREGKNHVLTVADLEGDRYFVTNTRNIAGVRDFNRVDIAGFEPDALEKMLSTFEGQVATGLKNVEVNKKFEGADRIAILNLVALLAVRSPQQREQMRKIAEELLKQRLAPMYASKDAYEAKLAEMAAAGKGPVAGEPEVTFEQAKEWFESGQFDISLNREYFIGLELEMHDTVLRALVARRWKLWTINDEEAGTFVTSDRPVVLVWQHPEEVPPMLRASPGYGQGGTEVIFPLTKSLLLVGTFDGGNDTAAATGEFVAGANLRIILAAYEQVYGPKKTIRYMTLDGQFHNDAHFMERFKQYKARRGEE